MSETINVGDESDLKTVRILVVGDSGVGKTQFINRLCFTSPLGVSTQASHNVEVCLYRDPQTHIYYVVEFVDVLGHKRYCQTRKCVYSDIDAIALVFDARSKRSIQSVPLWFGEISQSDRERGFGNNHHVQVDTTTADSMQLGVRAMLDCETKDVNLVHVEKKQIFVKVPVALFGTQSNESTQFNTQSAIDYWNTLFKFDGPYFGSVERETSKTDLQVKKKSWLGEDETVDPEEQLPLNDGFAALEKGMLSLIQMSIVRKYGHNSQQQQQHHQTQQSMMHAYPQQYTQPGYHQLYQPQQPMFQPMQYNQQYQMQHQPQQQQSMQYPMYHQGYAEASLVNGQIRYNEASKYSEYPTQSTPTYQQHQSQIQQQQQQQQQLQQQQQQQQQHISLQHSQAFPTYLNHNQEQGVRRRSGSGSGSSKSKEQNYENYYEDNASLYD